MNITEVINENAVITIIDSDSIVISDAQSAIDMIMNAKYASNSDYIAINKEAIAEEFFILSTLLVNNTRGKIYVKRC